MTAERIDELLRFLPLFDRGERSPSHANARPGLPMTVRLLGIAYFTLVVADGVLSLLLLAFPDMERVSEAVSWVVLPATVAALVLSLIGRLRPRALFLVPVLLYGMAAHLFVAVMLALLITGQQAPLAENAGLPELLQALPWFAPVYCAINAGIVATAIVCCYLYIRSPGTRADPV